MTMLQAELVERCDHEVTGAVVLLANIGSTFRLAILGVVIALTGVVHLLAGFELAGRSGRRWRPGVPLACRAPLPSCGSPASGAS
jgi:hypothetical protein